MVEGPDAAAGHYPHGLRYGFGLDQAFHRKIPGANIKSGSIAHGNKVFLQTNELYALGVAVQSFGM